MFKEKNIVTNNQIQSTVPTGTSTDPKPPLQITSTDCVANLNADMVDDHNTNDITPVGSIIALDPLAPEPNSQFWTLCDGTSFPAGSFRTGAKPNLTDKRFLMGDLDSSLESGGTNDSLPHTHEFTQPTVPAHYHSTQSSGASLTFTINESSHGHEYTDNCVGSSFGTSIATSSGPSSILSSINCITLTKNTSDVSHSHSHSSCSGEIGLVNGGSNGDSIFSTINGSVNNVTEDITDKNIPQYYKVKYYIKYR